MQKGVFNVVYVCSTCNDVATCNRKNRQWKSLKRFARIHSGERKRDKVKKRGGKYPQKRF